MDNKSFTEIKFSKSEHVRTLAYLTEKKVSGQHENKKETSSLFHRLLILAERSANVESYFRHELTTIPTALFKDDFMRKPNKPELAKCITKNVLVETSVIASPDSQFVLDGGSLLHKVRWYKDATFGSAFRQYSKHIFSHYGRNSFIVFDGYASTASTKDHEHRRRANGLSCVPSQVDIQLSKRIVFDQHTFLANNLNKQTFIKHLMAHLVEQGFQTRQSDSDADTLIVSTAIDLAAKLSSSVTVVAEDTDILVLLAYHLKDNMSDILLVSETKRARKPVKKLVSIRALQTKLGTAVCQQLLTVHALGGCDTTSALYGVGKATVYKRIKNCHLMPQVETMQNSEADEKSVSEAGLNLMVIVYGGNDKNTLDKMRFSSYTKMVSSSLSNLLPQKLPPTERSAHYHVLRCHYQAIAWKELSPDAIDPLKWGWTKTETGLEPIMTDLQSAPDDLLKIVRCKCKASCKTSSCTCRKNGMKCLSACQHCRGVMCSNSVLTQTCVDNDEDPCEEPNLFMADSEIYYIDEEVVSDVIVDDGEVTMVVKKDSKSSSLDKILSCSVISKSSSLLISLAVSFFSTLCLPLASRR